MKCSVCFEISVHFPISYWQQCGLLNGYLICTVKLEDDPLLILLLWYYCWLLCWGPFFLIKIHDFTVSVHIQFHCVALTDGVCLIRAINFHFIMQVEGMEVHANEGGVTQTRGGLYCCILPAGCNILSYQTN